MGTPEVGIIVLTATMGLVTWAITYLAKKQANNSED